MTVSFFKFRFKQSVILTVSLVVLFCLHIIGVIDGFPVLIFPLVQTIRILTPILRSSQHGG